MRLNSISNRLFVLSALWLVIALAATALLLTELYSRALDRALTQSLDFQLEALVADALSQQDLADEGLDAADPRFGRIASGWYWQVEDADGNVVGISGSLIGSVLPQIESPFDDDGRRSAILRDDFDISIRVIERSINLPQGSFQFIVSGNLDDNVELTNNFRTQTLIVLLAVGVALAIMSAIVGRVALWPVEKLRGELEDVRDGTKPEISQDYPSELEPLADEVNTLLSANAKIVERARAQVGNLAHGLKTPIAVLKNEAANQEGNFGNVVREQVERMSQIVANYLDRARMASRTAVVGKRCDASAILERLSRVMRKIHVDREISSQLVPDIWFRGDESDLEEMVGNLFDNGCKWAHSKVRLEVSAPKELRGQFEILIEDDGAGLSAQEQAAVLKRGVRLDEKVQGSGLGLDIVKELVDIYGGEFLLGKSELGGLKVTLRLPAAKSPN